MLTLLHFARALPILSPAPTLEAVSHRLSAISVTLCLAICYERGLLRADHWRPTASFEKEETVSLRWLGSNTRASALPTPHTLVRAVYIGRACIAVAIYLAAALKFKVAAPLDILVTSFVLVATAVVTIASYWHTHVRGRAPGLTFLYSQALFDVALVTTVVHVTGGPQSDLTSLYVPLIAVTAVLMPPRSAALITTLVGLVYIADVFFGHSTPLTPDVAIQLAVFVVVAAVTAYVASRVKLMGAEREALAGELRQARLEAAGGRRARREPPGDRDLHRHLRLQAAGAAPPARRAAGGGGGAVLESRARDQESARFDPLVRGAAGPRIAGEPR